MPYRKHKGTMLLVSLLIADSLAMFIFAAVYFARGDLDRSGCFLLLAIGSACATGMALIYNGGLSIRTLLKVYGYRIEYHSDYGVHSSRYDGCDFHFNRPIHPDMSVAPPWAKRKIVPIQVRNRYE